MDVAKRPKEKAVKRSLIANFGNVGCAIKTTKTLVGVLRMTNSKKMPGT